MERYLRHFFGMLQVVLLCNASAQSGRQKAWTIPEELQDLRNSTSDTPETCCFSAMQSPAWAQDPMPLACNPAHGAVIPSILILLSLAAFVCIWRIHLKNQRLIARQKRIIADAGIEKEALLKEIHHRVKNNLQIVSSLLSLQTKNTNHPEVIEALNEGKSRVKAMALIHQQLYQHHDLSIIAMQDYIESLATSVQAVYKKCEPLIAITINARGAEFNLDQAIPLGLILNELLSNAFKYAFPNPREPGNIAILLRKQGRQNYFEYTDNGIGFPKEVEIRTHSGVGIQLINRLVQQLHSQLHLDQTGKGVRFWFTFTG